MKKEEAKNYFKYLFCADKFILSKKRCAFYWWEQDYWGECDEGCYLCKKNVRTKFLCYLPYFVQSIILRIMQHIENKKVEKMFYREETE